MTLQAKLQEIEARATAMHTHVITDPQSEFWLRVGASQRDVPALARALQIALKGLWHYSGEEMRVGSTITPMHADKALTEIAKILLPEGKV